MFLSYSALTKELKLAWNRFRSLPSWSYNQRRRRKSQLVVASIRVAGYNVLTCELQRFSLRVSGGYEGPSSGVPVWKS